MMAYIELQTSLNSLWVDGLIKLIRLTKIIGLAFFATDLPRLTQTFFLSALSLEPFIHSTYSTHQLNQPIWLSVLFFSISASAIDPLCPLSSDFCPLSSDFCPLASVIKIYTPRP
jgi:hypothetical protein